MRVGLEREQRQHVIDIGPHRARPARPPRPDGRRDVVDDRNPRRTGAHAFGDAMGEIGAVDDDENVGRRLDHGIGRLADAPQDRRQLPDHGGKPDDRQFLDRKARGEPLARHGTAADAFELYGATEPLAQHLHQIGAEAIAGFLRRDQENLPPGDGVGARSVHADRPVTNRPALSAASIMACASATNAWPAATAMPARPASAAPSTVREPTAGRS